MTPKQQIVLAKLKANGGQITGSLINDLILDHQPIAYDLIRKYNAYRADELEILQRTFEDQNKINNKINNDYRGVIVLQTIGYLFGNPITYQVDKNKYNESDYKAYINKLSDFKIMNSMEDLDMETGKLAAICGYGARLLYIDKEGLPTLINYYPWEVIFLEDSKGNPLYALRYYSIYDADGNRKIKVEWYDSKSITYFEGDGVNYYPDLSIKMNPQPHLFSDIPLIKFQNNNEELGDFDKVEAAINAYDKVVSDSQNEIEEFRQAYMTFIGAEIDGDTIKAARQTGAFSLPEGTDAKFLIKEINTEFYKEQKNTLNDNIYKFSQAVDMSDEKFSGSAQTGESRKWKLIALENKAIVKQNKFTKALRRQFKLLCDVWRTKDNINLNYLDIFFEYNRNLPVDLQYLSEVAKNFKGIISDRTLLGQMPMIDDVDYELQLIKDEQEDSLTDNYQLDSQQISGDAIE